MKRFLVFAIVLAAMGCQLEDIGSKGIASTHVKLAAIEAQI